MTSLPIVEDVDSSQRVSHSVQVLMAYAGIRHMKDLALRVSIPQQTMSRRMNGLQGWQFFEVVRIAVYFHVTLDEILNGLPTLEEWTDRHLRACRDSNPKPSVLEPRRLRLIRGGRKSVKPTLTVFGPLAAWGPVAAVDLRAVR